MITPNSPTRLTLRDSAGVPLLRWTLQCSDRQGRKLSYPPEVSTTKGAAPNHALAHVFRGFRPELDITWAYSLASLLEVYDGSAWLPGTSRATAAGLLAVLDACESNTVYVEPYAGSAGFDFAGRCYAEAQTLKDIKGVVHSGLALKLTAEGLIDQIPAGVGSSLAYPGGSLDSTPSGGSLPAYVVPASSGGGSGGGSLVQETSKTLALDGPTGTVDLGAKTVMIVRIAINGAGRFRLYQSAAARDADFARPYDREIEPGNGLLLDELTSYTLRTVAYSPVVSGALLDSDQWAWAWSGAAGATATVEYYAGTIAGSSYVPKDGSRIYSGNGAPSASIGGSRDYYLDQSNGDWWTKATGVWALGCSLRGPQGDNGPAGVQGSVGPTGAAGAAGVGVPTGGASGQILSKNSGSDYDTQWIDAPNGGGASLTPNACVNGAGVATGATGVVSIPLGTPPSAGVAGTVQLYADYTSGNLVPTMTSATAPSGVVTCSSQYGSYLAWQAFTNTTSANGWATNGGGVPCWLGYQFPSARTITSYSILPSADVFPGRLPLEWTLQGSNDGYTWTTVDTQVTTSASWSSTVLRTFTVANPGSYTRYRIYITRNGGDSYTSIRWLYLNGVDTSQPPTLRVRLADGSIKTIQIS